MRPFLLGKIKTPLKSGATNVGKYIDLQGLEQSRQKGKKDSRKQDEQQ